MAVRQENMYEDHEGRIEKSTQERWEIGGIYERLKRWKRTGR